MGVCIHKTVSATEKCSGTWLSCPSSDLMAQQRKYKYTKSWCPLLLGNIILRAMRLFQGIPWPLHMKSEKKNLWLNDNINIDASSCFTPALFLNCSLTILCASQLEFSIPQAQSLKLHPVLAKKPQFLSKNQVVYSLW